MEKLTSRFSAVSLEWSAQFRSQTVTLADYMDSGEKKKSSRSSLEQDFLNLSPMAQIQQTLTQFRRESQSQGTLKLDISVSARDLGSPEKYGEFAKGFDLLLRLMAHDDNDYQRLREQFSDMFSITQNYMGQGPAPETGQVVQTSAETPVLPPTNTEATASASQASGQVDLHVEFQRTDGRLEIQQVHVQPQQQTQKIDPLVLDLAGNGIRLTPAGQGARFDIDGDGKTDSTSWVKGDDALLWLDKNNNGTLDNGKELFGDQNGAKNGFAELAKLDQNQDGKITKQDQAYKALRLYRDLNGDGKVQANESTSAAQAGVKEINLRFVRDGAVKQGNTLLLNGSFLTNDGRQNQMADFLFGFKKG